MTAETILDAVTTLLRIEFRDALPVFTAGDVPGGNGQDSDALPTRWVEVGVTRSPGGAYRTVGASSSSYHYLTLGAADENAPSARVWQERMRAALEGLQVSVGPTRSSPVRFYAEDEVAWLRDLARYWQLTTYSLSI